MVINLTQHLADMTEALGVTSLRDVKDQMLCMIQNSRHRLLLGVRRLGDLTCRSNQLPKNALFLDDAGIILDVERIGNRFGQCTDVILSARLIVNPLDHQHIDQRYHVDLTVGQEQLVHCQIDLLMLGQIKVL